MDKSIRFWDRVSRNTDRRTSGYDQTVHSILAKTRPYLDPGDVVLDFACGTGTFSCGLAGHVQEVTAIDISSGMLDVAKSKANERQIENVEFVQSAIFDDRHRPESFDVVLAFNILHLLQDAPRVMQRFNDLLRPGGLLVSCTPCLGEKRSPLGVFLVLLSKLSLVPYLNTLTISSVEELLVSGRFQVVEAETLEHKPPNYFSVAKKVGEDQSST
jgi:2-polyprenyl-3-methyl-5-hydroxy-6-metoxy-1,4-benzoquinol methylase